METDVVYTGKNIFLVSGWYGLDYWQRGRALLNISLNKKTGKYFNLFIKVDNILTVAAMWYFIKPMQTLQQTTCPRKLQPK